MCYFSGQTGIIQRMLREEGGWQSHLEYTGNYILDAVNKYQPKTIRLLGSGWLLDVPIKELIEKCDKIFLVDIIHPRQIVSKYSKYPNIIFETTDLTGGVANLVFKQPRKSFDYSKLINNIQRIPRFDYKEDLVVSINLLSQLSIFITDYLSEKFRLTHDQLVEVAEIIQQNHLDSLPRGKSVISTDYEEVFYSEDDKLIGTNPTVFINLPKNSTSKEWDWLFDFKMTYKEDRKTLLRIAAIML